MGETPGLRYRRQQEAAAQQELSSARREAREAGRMTTGPVANQRQLEAAQRARKRQEDYARSVGRELSK